MSQQSIVIVDYQMGNLRSVQKALEHSGQQAVVSSNAVDIQAADKLILPGVGAFGDAISELKQRDLLEPIAEFIRKERPFLGICLGLQMLFDEGLEGIAAGSDPHQGMGVLPGEVLRFPARPGLKVPHMGWNKIQVQQDGCPLLRGIDQDAHFYFVHSYYVDPRQKSDVWLSCDYEMQFCAAVWRDNIFATQFHPEKSQQDGLQLLRNFAEL